MRGNGLMSLLWGVGLILLLITGQPAQASPAATGGSLATATFAGGCFWCMEAPFDALPGVISTTAGYIGGHHPHPTYQAVSAGSTGHVEAVQITYEPTALSYERLLDVFWHNVDPLDAQGQFCDQGSQYRSAIFYHDATQQTLAERSKASLSVQWDVPIQTDIQPATVFYPAEDYHQNYYQTHPIRYRIYRAGCGRDQRLSDLWERLAS
jgi:peptide-methionine (S)-S-oxide reductase